MRGAARLLTETYRQTESKPHALRRALSLENILNHIGIFMCDDDMLLGAIAEKRRGSSVFPEFGVQFIENELTGNPVDFSTRPYDPYIVEPEVRRELLEDILPYWKDRCEEALVYSQLPAETMMANEKGVGGYDGTWITRGGRRPHHPRLGKAAAHRCQRRDPADRGAHGRAGSGRSQRL